MLGAIFSGIVSKVTSLAGSPKSKKKTKELPNKANANISGIAAYMRRHPKSDALVNMSLDELLEAIEAEDFTDEEVHGREPWSTSPRINSNGSFTTHLFPRSITLASVYTDH